MTTPETRRSLREQPVSSGAPAVASASETRTPARGVGRAVGDMLLWIAAVGGVICIVLVVLALTAQITLIMFRTGSMSPTIPAGSVAVVQRIPASEIAIGDVVTVDRAGELPVTHRVTSTEPGRNAEERVITMRGDANASDDPFPYAVTSVRIVLFSIPGIAMLIAGMGNPVVLGALTVGATVLVVWAFWPRSGRRSRPEPTGGAG
ncbi:signal peptidase I [Microbacterium sp. SA39]|uniref:signal peptidase I n=1 Tax=Microbacterium sp. SA39 TaxID=1263625 RepID=UPI00061DFE6F|nr:signal peptidase I [Microbacterium sp. SA39]KJQ54123.1 Signal peptidase I W [Microbacterium sp. SA39]